MSRHIGRSYAGPCDLETRCPCAKAPCGLVLEGHESPDCDQHPWWCGKTIRTSHPADQCPGDSAEVAKRRAAAYTAPVRRRLTAASHRHTKKKEPMEPNEIEFNNDIHDETNLLHQAAEDAPAPEPGEELLLSDIRALNEPAPIHD